MQPLLIKIQWFVLVATVVIAILFFWVHPIPFVPGAAIGVFVLACVAFVGFSLSKTSFPPKGGFLSILFSFFGLLLGVSGTIYLATVYHVSPHWVAIGLGIVIGALIGAAAATYLEITALHVSFGGILGLSADAVKSGIPKPDELSKTWLGSLAGQIDALQQWITNLLTESSAPIRLEPGVISFFLWSAVFGIACTVFIGICMRYQLEKGLKQQVPPQTAMGQQPPGAGAVHQPAGAGAA